MSVRARQPDLAGALAAKRQELARRRAERRSALSASAEGDRVLIDNLPLMIFKLDREGTVLSANKHGARELGYGSSELVGRPVFGLIHAEERPALERQLAWALDSPGKALRWELRKLRRDGSEMWVRETVRAVHDDDGSPEILMVCEDVSERRRAVGRLAEYRDRLRDLNAELSRLEEREDRRIARVLHDEVGQTLAAARMAICELRDWESVDDRSRRLEELRQMIEASIEVTRSLTFQLSPPILYELGLTAALQALGEKMERDHGIALRFELTEGWSPPPDGIAEVVYRAVRELLHNVVKHARASSVRLDFGGTGDRTWIRLEDDGVGFDASAGHPAAGRSLGLFHVRERMVRLGGRFEIDSAPGRGTRALLTLPAGEWTERRRSDRRKLP